MEHSCWALAAGAEGSIPEVSGESPAAAAVDSPDNGTDGTSPDKTRSQFGALQAGIRAGQRGESDDDEEDE